VIAHGFEGKDRTGFTVACVLDAIGVTATCARRFCSRTERCRDAGSDLKSVASAPKRHEESPSPRRDDRRGAGGLAGIPERTPHDRRTTTAGSRAISRQAGVTTGEIAKCAPRSSDSRAGFTLHARPGPGGTWLATEHPVGQSTLCREQLTHPGRAVGRRAAPGELSSRGFGPTSAPMNRLHSCR